MNAFGGDSYGQVTLDGELLSKEVFKKRCYLVAQQESHWASLTCVETLVYAAQLYLGRSAAEVETYVDDLLRRNGLASCKVCPASSCCSCSVFILHTPPCLRRISKSVTHSSKGFRGGKRSASPSRWPSSSARR